MTGIIHNLSDPSNYKVGTSQVDKIFLGTDALWPQVYLQGSFIGDFPPSGTALAGIDIKTTGSVEEVDSSGVIGYYTWKLAGATSDYQVRATKTSGSLSDFNAPGTELLNTWYTVSSDVNFRINRPTTGDNTLVFTLEVRRVSDSVVIATTSVSLEAQHA